ncbi:hypothetical protein RB653_006376 [Dictyostelium firmibasis]|uniref:Uncharacterized protein n=1 Tax=Dictyostelium firmibasis TaxID=79012 RepID=A0AAN7U2M6_9MYCE
MKILVNLHVIYYNAIVKELLKMIFKSKSIGMHKNLQYVECMANKVITICIALKDTSNENGTIEFIEGSHRWKDLPTKK